MQNNQCKDRTAIGSNSIERHVYYVIKIQDHLDQVWAGWFEGMALTYTQDSENGVEYTLIAGPVVDQPALHGLLTKIRDLNLTLISVHRSVPEKNTLEEVPIKPEPFEDGADFA